MKMNAMTYSQGFSSSISGVGESSSRSIELPEKSKSKLLDEDGGDCNCFNTASKISCLPLRPKCADCNNVLL
jgi:hypothetical protein